MAFTGTLLPFQEVDVNRLLSRPKHLVALDMGLGKTVISIAVVEQLMDEGKITEPGIVVALSSLKYQWRDQIENFTQGTSKSIVIDGTPKQRAKQYELVADWRNSGVDYVLMNYETVVSDWEAVSRLPRGFLVADEGTALKGFSSKRSKAVKKLATPDLRLVLTGSPMENGKPEEVFSIMEAVDRQHLGSYRAFDARYIVRNAKGWPVAYENVSELHERLSEVMIRRKQDDPEVSPFLPESLVKPPMQVPWDKAGARLYRQIAQELIRELLEMANAESTSTFDVAAHYGRADMALDEDTVQGRVRSRVMALRLLCCHPDLLRASQSPYVKGLVRSGVLDAVHRAPKLEMLKTYVDKVMEDNPRNKIVIFTHFVGMTEILREVVKYHGVALCTGSLNASQKNAEKHRFKSDPDVRIMVSSDAGGYGVDLPEGNVLINYDLADTSGGAMQRNARIRRASSTWKHVVVQDLLMADSVEVRSHRLLQQKRDVEAAVLDGTSTSGGGSVFLTVGAMLTFLQSRNPLQ